MKEKKNWSIFPLNVQQIITISIQITNIIAFTVVFFYVSSNLPLLLVVSVLELAVIIIGYIATVSDPFFYSDSYPEEFLEFYCSECECNVLEGCKHCKYCNMCIVGFDHHCKYINNCVGKKNYKHFLALIISLAVLEASLLVFFIHEFIFIVYEGFDTEQIIILLLVIGEIILHSFIFVANSSLILFHIYLKFKKITTYQFITQNKIRPIISNETEEEKIGNNKDNH